MNTVHYTTQDIIKAVSPAYYQRGMTYYREGRVGSVRFMGNQLAGHVVGSEDYEQLISLGGKDIEGACSCPIGYNCKHVAAVLLAALEDSAVDYAAETITIQNRAQPANANKTVQDDVISDYATRHWLEQIKLATQGRQPEAKASTTPDKNLVYILKTDKNNTAKIVPFTVSFKKDGTYSRTNKAYNVENVTARREVPGYISMDDQFILHSIAKSLYSYVSPEDGYDIKNADILRKILKSGKCHWQELDGVILAEGEPRQATLSWHMLDDGRQQIACQTAQPDDHIIKLASPWYVSAGEGLCGKLNADMPDHVVGTLLAAPALAPIEVEAVRRKLQDYAGAVAIPVPSGFQHTEILREKPVPCLYLYGRRLEEVSGYWHNRKSIEAAIARVNFAYGNHAVAVDSRETILTSVRGDTLLKYQRDTKQEQRHIGQLRDIYGLRSIQKYQRNYTIPRDIAQDLSVACGEAGLNSPNLAEAWTQFMVHDVPELQKTGWRVEIDASFPFNITHPDDDWYAEIDESSGMDWFGLELGVSVDGQKTNLLPILLAALKDKSHVVNTDLGEPSEGALWYFPLQNGGRLALPARRIWTMMSFLRDLYSFQTMDEDGNLRLSRLEAADLAELEAAMKALDMRWFGGEKVRKLGQQLKNFTGIHTVSPPKDFQAELREYQKEGLSWMQFLREYGLAGILADDMGLGKTIQALAYVMREKEDKRLDKPVLVVAPTSVLVNWRMEAARFAPTLKTLALHGGDRHQHFDAIGDYELVLTTYPLLHRDKDVLLKQQFHTIILDEAQYIKNTKAKNTQIACQIKADHRICMTGTPIENHLGELWSQFNFLLPGFLGDEKQFRQFFRNPIEKDGNNERNAALVRRIKPFILRRTKDQIATELPPKTFIIRTASLEKSQRDLYETIRVSMQKKVRDEIASKGFARSHIIVLEALLKLRQTCCDPRLLKIEAAKKVQESAKLEMLMDMLPEMVEEGRKILLFSQFVSMLSLIEDELKQKEIKYVKLTGQTKDRKTPIESFQNGEVPLFLISLKAGGTGLNLTAADTVIHYDPWWNPAAENQATDRAHRIGQDKPVFVYKLLTEGTVEEKILQMQEKKHALAEGIFNPDSKAASTLTADDISALFEPLG